MKQANCACGGQFRFAGRHALLMDTLNGVRMPLNISMELQVDQYICEECHEIKWYAADTGSAAPSGEPNYGDLLGYSDRGLCAVINDRDNSEETKALARKILSQRHPPADRGDERIDREEIESYCRVYRTYSTGDLQRMYADAEYPAVMHEALGRLLAERGKQTAAEKEQRSYGQKAEKDSWDL